MSNETSFSHLGKFDKAGIACSGACAAHCLLLPILAFASPSISSLSENEWIHLGLLIALVPIALIAFIRSYKVHENKKPSLFGGLGVFLLLAAVALESFHLEIPHLEKALTAIGSVMLIIGHTLNMTYLNRSKV